MMVRKIEGNEDLQEYRRRIDEIDNQLLDLLIRRMKIARQVGKLKTKLNLTVEDRSRETEIISRLQQLSHNRLTRNQIEAIFTAVFKAAREVQAR